jgi:glyoxylase-like metal-dependent hydrolase (beta-lactamase superfamily II)
MAKIMSDEGKSDIAAMLQEEYGIHKIPIVSRMFGFVVNTFFVEKPYPTLVDVPPDESTYLNKLQSGLKKVGYSIGDVRRIIVTHPHFDHFGLARTIAEMTGAEVWVPGGGARWFESFEEEIHKEETFRRSFLLQSGASDTEIRDVNDYYCRANSLARNVKPDRFLKEGDLFELSSLSFTVTSVPGHTPWCVLFSDLENRLAFSGDFLQPVTANPLIQRMTRTLESYNSIRLYIQSLVKVRAMNQRIILPGHGEIIEDGTKRIEDILSMIDQRRKLILHILKEPGQTPVEIGRRLFPDLLPGRLFNAVSEITAHLEILEQDRLVARVGNDPARFCLRSA